MYNRTGPKSLRRAVHKEDFCIRIFLRSLTERSVSIGDVEPEEISPRTQNRAMKKLIDAGIMEESRRSYRLGDAGLELLLDLLEHHGGEIGERLANETGHDPLHYRMKDVENAVAEARSQQGDERGM